MRATLRFIKRYVQKLLEDRAGSLAALLSWGMLNTLIPLMVCILTLAGMVLRDPEHLAAAEDALIAVLPAQAAPLVQSVLESAVTDGATIGLISLGFLLWNGTNFFAALEEVFDLAYKVPMRPFITQRLLAVGGLLCFTGLVIAAAVTAGVAFVSSLSLFAAFQLLYMVLPNRQLRWQSALPGAVIVTVLFQLIGRLFPLYVALFGGGFSVYLAAGTLLLFLFWLYVICLVIVGGAELNALLERPPHGAASASTWQPDRVGSADSAAST